MVISPRDSAPRCPRRPLRQALGVLGDRRRPQATTHQVAGRASAARAVGAPTRPRQQAATATLTRACSGLAAVVGARQRHPPGGLISAAAHDTVTPPATTAAAALRRTLTLTLVPSVARPRASVAVLGVPSTGAGSSVGQRRLALAKPKAWPFSPEIHTASASQVDTCPATGAYP